MEQIDLKYKDRYYTVDFVADYFKDELYNKYVTQIEEYKVYVINDDLTSTLMLDINKELDDTVCRAIANYMEERSEEDYEE
jgi:hypothetical protein